MYTVAYCLMYTAPPPPLRWDWTYTSVPIPFGPFWKKEAHRQTHIPPGHSEYQVVLIHCFPVRLNIHDHSNAPNRYGRISISNFLLMFLSNVFVLHTRWGFWVLNLLDGTLVYAHPKWRFFCCLFYRFIYAIDLGKPIILIKTNV